MDLIAIVLIAVGLAIDAFAVSIASGISITHRRRRTAVLMASSFAFFQMLMPVIGWAGGIQLQDLIVDVDHWVAFGLLAFIGSKMIYDSFQKDGKQQATLKPHVLLTLSVATSIDALMVGLSFAFLQTSIVTPIAAIGAVTFGLSCVGFFFGNTIAKVFGNKIKAIGGIILIAIGIQILIEHLLL